MKGWPTLHPPAIGERFGIMTVLAVHERHTANSLTKWKLKCDCGNETVAIAADLRHGRRVSCGCLRRKALSSHDAIGNHSLRTWFRGHCNSAKKRGVPQHLLFDEWKWLRDQPCVYCGAAGPNGIDRLQNDHSIGYTRENSAPCCKHCNTRKHMMDASELLEWTQRILKHTGGRVPQAPLPTRNLGKREHVQEMIFRD